MIPSRQRVMTVVGLLCVLAALIRAFALGPTPPANADDLIGNILNQVSTETLLNHVRDLSGERPVDLDGETVTITTRHSRSAEIKLAERYLRRHFENRGLQVVSWPYGTEGAHNIVAIQPGLVHPEQVYIICAHHDSRTSSIGDYWSPAPGADDNASGVAAVMQAATILSQYQFQHTIYYVTFSGEEQGLFGSRAYAYQAHLLGANILGVINLDMIAYDKKGEPDFQLHANSSPASQAAADTFKRIVAQYRLGLSIQTAYGDQAMGSSDHEAFWENRFPAMLGIENYPADFNHCYHRACDRVDLFNQGYFAAAAKGAIGTLATLARPLPAPAPTLTPTATPTPLPPLPCANHLLNGDFEAGPPLTGWRASSPHGYVLLSSQVAHAGRWAAWLSQRDLADDRLCQTVSIPAGARNLTLEFWWQMQTDERWHSSDWLEARLRPTSSVFFGTLARLDDGGVQHRWQRVRQELDPAYAGQQVELCFVAGSDYSDRTWFFIDDVQISYCQTAAASWLPLVCK